ncbi:MAG: bifunctional adenosylcobinamide kinase/adenosylcobinamide-phosphate guanylyltransferase [Candidatus Rokubacteria bacterium]|nr:bifunctional adenosylcobinamide kinase/adenosylcobinamide-phosphate guanylyltransferase [Candidatus Rokubacteria bacterium]
MSLAHRSDLILGGVRSGKSREALRLAAAMPRSSRGAFLATAQALDGDMEARIARHRAERPAGWATIEEPYDVVAACESLAGRVDVVVLDCVTLWVANLLLRGDEEKTILAAADALADFLAERRFSLVIVSNEVGAGLHPPTEVGLRFGDALGGVNQRIAAAADRVRYMVAGLPMTIKDLPLPEPSRERPPEAP